MKLKCNSCDGAFDSLDVRFTKRCDNACPFCIERTGIKALPEANAEAMANAAISTGIRSTLILGGEPLLRLYAVTDFVSRIRPFMDTIYLTTSMPATADNKVMNELVSMLSGLNVSVQSGDWKENNRLFRASSGHNRLELAKDLNRRHPGKLRACINLVKGGIDSWEKLNKTILTLKWEYGFRNFKISELQHEPDLFVPLDSILGGKYKSPFSNGCNVPDERLSRVFDAKILLKYSCFLVEPSRKASMSDLVKILVRPKPKNKFAVLYEDASIKGGWKKC